MGTLPAALCTFMIFRLIIVRMSSFIQILYRKSKHTFCVNNFFFSEDLSGYEIRWKNAAEPDGPHVTIWHMGIACWIPKATYTYAEYVILIAFPLQQWLHERASM
jgi:hypothetical protein